MSTEKLVPSPCRVCLSPTTTYTSLFIKNEQTPQVSNADLIMKCASVHIKQNDGFPDIICFPCLDKLRNAVEFRETCERSDQWLKVNGIKQDLSVAEHCELHFSDVSNEGADRKVDVKPTEEEIEKVERIDDGLKYTCGKCGEKFARKKLLGRHDQLHHTNENTCVTCNKSFDSPKELRQHRKTKDHEVQTKTPGYERTCLLCKETFYRAKFWGKHRDTKHKDNKCTICGQTFKHFNYLMGHVEIKHFVAPYLCPECGVTLAELRSLNTHINRVHLKVTRHACDECDKRYFFPHQLRLHKIRIHETKRQFTCDICDAKFKEMSRLRLHKLIHSDEGQYECLECNKKFKTPVTFKRHKIWHTGVKKYVCEYCDKSFMFNKYLTQHLRIHTGEKPFVCTICNVGFAQSASLKYHKQNHHADKKVGIDLIAAT